MHLLPPVIATTMANFGVLLLLAALVQHATCQIKGVNLGGWLLVEKWITPSLYDSTVADDEWALCSDLGKRKCAAVLRNHWKTFINQADFKDIKTAGLNTVRIPIGYWAIDLLDYEPYVSGQFSYLTQAVQWAGEAGIGVIISLHGAPGSQNAQENSGYDAANSFFSNTSNIDRTLHVLSNLTQEFSQSQYGDAVKSIELLNEPRLTSTFTLEDLTGFYASGFNAVRAANHDGSINVTIHDAFQLFSTWKDYGEDKSKTTAPSTSNVLLDTHQYYPYAGRSNLSQNEILRSVCSISKQLKQDVQESKLPSTFVGEWSLATSEGQVSSDVIDNTKAYHHWLQLFFEAQNSAYSPNGHGQASIGWIFWTWKTENDANMWSYRQGITEGYIPSNVSDDTLFRYKADQDGCITGGANPTVKPTLLTLTMLVTFVMVALSC
ncbi:glycoside hydrolase family 5 protein [Polychaeton citri CBS 116435]|uniref:Glycoside hydrolase family 5 protein n=1 Tax=Polychaeton citri CBS 116435 TaxID=1314669 RepID=A0A9P4Q7F2_9PEZI|nr:glycoside hydrolase family 5 protein [Polychaeton citri CBS 116435]